MILGLLATASALAAGGTIVVESPEEGLPIVVDGAPTGLLTPARIEGLAPGFHTVSVQGGCHTGSLKVLVEEGATQLVPLQLDVMEGELRAWTEPAGGAIVLNDQRLPPLHEPGETWPVPCGTHSLQASLPGHHPTVLTIDIAGGERLDLPITLEPIGTATLVLGVEPRKAEVVLDGVPLGAGPRTVEGVVAGPHVLVVRLPEHREHEQQLVLENDQTLELSVVLEPLEPAVAAAPPPRRGRALRVTGLSLAGAGVGVAGIATASWLSSRGDYLEYLHRSGEEQAGMREAGAAEAWYAAEVRPDRDRLLLLSGVSGVLLASGVTLVVVF